jgi:hypothetical protein
VALAVLVTIVVYGLIFLNNDLVPPPFSLDVTKYLTRIAMVVLALGPAAYWLWLYRGRS